MITLIILLELSFSNRPDHDFDFGRYEIRPAEDHVSLYVQLDLENLLQAVDDTCPDRNVVGLCFSEYISEHFKLTFDGEEVCLDYKRHDFVKEFVNLYFTIPIDPKGIKEIKVYNDVFLELKDGQENIVYSQLHDLERSFRMNKNRLQTIISY